ncbi:uncharacterized protein LOC105208249 [Solenopsis invicta]|uniref:uncharacterized protein LOC105208249 n=1 Tax=Solenopsis invicta TaxID=13686 RepID=UPI00193E6E57|nr:uncharacterized protein LOC105208249 [Solenopsis invicta]
MANPWEDLVQAQHDLFGLLSQSYENMRKSGEANITLGLLEARLQTLESYWGKFVTRHEQLLMEYGDDLEDHEYLTDDLMLKADISFHVQKGKYLDDMRTMRGPGHAVFAAPVAAPAATSAAAVAAAAPTIAAAAPVVARLPRISILQFSGQYEVWPAFCDLFSSLVISNQSATLVEKLHYLKTSLKGEAEQVTRQLSTTEANFERTWRALKEHYENKRLLVRSYISRLLSLLKMKGESAADLRKIYHCVQTTVRSLEGIGRPLTRSDDLCVQLITGLLDSVSRRKWETQLSSTAEPSSLDELLVFINQRMRTLESLTTSKSEARRRLLQVPLVKNRPYSKTAVERKQFAGSNELCVNCLSKHKLADCPSKKPCLSCNERHHSTLHDAYSAVAVVNTHLARLKKKAQMAMLLQTARVRVKDRCGVDHVVRALVDTGAEMSLVTESLAQRLRLPRSRSAFAVFGVCGKKSGVSRSLVELQSAWSHLNGITLADPEFLELDPVDILLGVDVYSTIIQTGARLGERGQPAAQLTALGWLVSGPVGPAGSSDRTLSLQCRIEKDLSSLVRNFWQLDDLPTGPAPLIPSEQECEDLYRRSHNRQSDGRYVVRLPVVAPLSDLAATKHAASRALTGTEKQLARDDRLRQMYLDFMRQYEDLGHMTPVQTDRDAGDRVSYLPHHGVLREASSTTKLRVVFNGSTTVLSGDSLNRSFLVGQNLLPPLADVLLRWRLPRYVLATDIEKMYRLILVHPEDRDLQRILWRYHPQDEMMEYRLNTVGVRSILGDAHSSPAGRRRG